MKSKELLQMYIFQVLLIIVLLIIISYLIKVRKTIKYEKRLSKYTVKNTNDINISLGDECQQLIRGIVNYIANIFYKNNILKDYVSHYEKFDHSLNRDRFNIYKILAIKILIALFFSFIYIVSSSLSASFDFLLLLVIFFNTFWIYDIYLRINEKKRTKNIENDLLKAIVIMNNAFKSGYNITQAIDYVIKDLKGPIGEEFTRINEDIKYGLDTKEVFDRFYNRVQISDAKLITSSLSLLNLTGGNLVGIFSSIEKSITNKKRLRDELNAMTSSSNLVYKILMAMPFILIGIILVISPNYFSPLFTNPIGYGICVLIILLFLFYIFVIRKILEVDV